MFERRLKIFLVALLLVTGAMLLRAVQLQVFGRSHWQTQAVESMKRPRLVETTRGAILDRNGVPIAKDEACRDAAVDFRAVVEPPDPDWVKSLAIARVRREMGDGYGKATAEERSRRVGEQVEAVKHDIGQMWRALAQELDAKDPDAALERIDETRRQIVERVQMRRRYVWYHKYRRAIDEKKGVTAPWYTRWLLEEGEEGPDVDNFIEDVGEQEAPHAILRNITNDTYINLKKGGDKYPGLSFPYSAFRHYPRGTAGAHLLGRLSKVMHEDIARDPNLGRNELREYQKNDLIGRSGLEALCEPVLRGTRGQVVRVAGEETELSRVEAVPGSDVRATIDIGLQHDVEQMFRNAKIRNTKIGDAPAVIEQLEMHGAAVVIDVPSGEVLALASWPTFDANRFDELYYKLSVDDINQPLVNRATQWVIEPGSTVKPIVGLGAITDGLIDANHGIECTGYLQIRGQVFRTRHRCWTAKMFGSRGDDAIKHHRIPVPHRGHHGNADGFLTFSDALERSCNVYFATVADQLKIDGLARWMRAFGLGRRTGIGITENAGWVPTGRGMSGSHALGDTWNGGIGQGQVGSTTLQMANVAATIARDGVWVRPRLVASDVPRARPTTVSADGPDRVDLKLSPAAIASAKQGMYNVVYADGGTADEVIVRGDVRVAGKTGSAQAPKFTTPIRDGRGNPKYECTRCGAPFSGPEQKQCTVDGCGGTKRRMLRQVWEATSPQKKGPIPWYRAFGSDGTELSHAWFIGYAPAEQPKIAFAVMIEYGGSGGFAAGDLANRVIQACINRDYIPGTKKNLVELEEVARQ